MTYLKSIVFALLGLSLLAGGFLAYVYRWLMTRPVPDLDGRIQAPILDAPVTVRRDTHGIPHIEAASRADLFRAQGLVHAQDRMWQMEQLRRITDGTLSELFGEAALDADHYARTIGFRRIADRELAEIWPHELEILEWYCEGINEYIRQREGNLAAEFRLLRYDPAPWQPVNCLAMAKLIAWTMSINWDGEILRLLVQEQLGAEAAADLDMAPTAQPPSILDELGETETERLVLTAQALLQEYEKINAFLPLSTPGQGSNSVVVAGSRSESGHPMLCNDPHLQVGMPGPLYEQHLTAPGLDAIGAMFPGAPGLVFGHSQHVAWGITAAVTDVQDLFVERIHPDHDNQYECDGAWMTMEEVVETFHVKGQPDPVEKKIRLTRHGPVMTDLVPEFDALPLALQWTGTEPGHIFHCLGEILAATSCSEAIAAFAHWPCPTLNFSVADTQGNIGYGLIGKHPIRGQGLGLLPSAGWKTANDWQGYVPYADLPGIHNPASGVIVTANNRIAAADSPVWLGCDFDPGYRAERIVQQLEDLPAITQADLRRVQLDSFSTFAEALTAILIRLTPRDSWEKYALKVLADWNYRMETASEGALVFHYLLGALLDEAFGAKLQSLYPRFLGKATNPLFTTSSFKLKALPRLLDLLQHSPQSRWYRDTENNRDRTRDTFLQEALQTGVHAMRSEMGNATRKWAWGRIHQIRFSHLMGSVFILRPLLNRGPYPIEGDATTPLQTTGDLGTPSSLVQVAPAYRNVMEIGNWDTMQSVVITGQSGHPMSRHYNDQIGMWREGEYHPMPFSAQAVRENTVYTLYLEP